jgi:hypothetical protein
MNRQDKASLHYKLHEKIVDITRCPELIQSVNMELKALQSGA